VTVAALFVARGGCYWGLPGVDAWDEARDARKYAGPWPVICHPPCARWGRYWHGGPSAKVRRTKGDDGGCFASALGAVRTWGGVLEHPADSAAWGAFGLIRPPRSGGWVVADWCGGWTCCVEQGHYGHRARKATWLYAVGVDLQLLKWGPSAARVRLDQGFHSADERRRKARGPTPPRGDPEARAAWLRRWKEITGVEHWEALQRLGKTERAATPLPFRDVLLAMARSVGRAETRTA
jgi:hypothetical protein